MIAEQSQRILLVDDDPGLLRLLSMRLEAVGYKVVTAISAEEALSRLPAFLPGLVITDLRMEGMDGMALFKAVHQQSPSLPVIMLTAHGTIPDAIAATKQGVYSFLTKPFDAKELLKQVAEALKQPVPNSADIKDNHWCKEILTQSTKMYELLNQARLVAGCDASVFIHGDSGTGKELLAKALHRASDRSDGPFVAVNCSAIPEALLESELFGHVKGAFTGAIRNHQGLFQAASGGSLFLDEIGDMPLLFQAKLLRALQEQRVRPVGATQDVEIDVRIISATHRDLDESVRSGTFREDLYYRLNVVSLDLPSLVSRREDIPLLANHFLRKIAAESNIESKRFSAEAMELLMLAQWPGNIRQLLNVVEQVVVLSTTPLITATLVEKALRSRPVEVPSFAVARGEFERDYLTRIMKMTSGNVSQAARMAGRNRTEFYKLLSKYHITPVMFKA